MKQFFVSMDFVIETFKYGDMIVCVLNIGIYWAHIAEIRT